ncbi:hypothetical protein [Corynebacterium phocae]|uniref:hypothetical protein n=1 Tax=Corynebacterium phocae TaxID=161895 RepID=UPI000951AD36|nr:hypothetical protein [Corynebacterium phocae]KAA8727460.1 hypothetical protein F4V58_01360 [Corynebacterium phocae]
MSKNSNFPENPQNSNVNPQNSSGYGGTNFGGTNSGNKYSSGSQPEETAVFGAQGTQGGGYPHQVFPESQTPQAGYGQQPGQPLNQNEVPFTATYAQPGPSSYAAPVEKRGGGATVIALAALLALSVIAAGIFALLYAHESSKPDPVPVTETLVTTEVSTTTATPKDIIPPADIPTELPEDLQNGLKDFEESLNSGADEVQSWLDEILGELEKATN